MGWSELAKRVQAFVVSPNKNFEPLGFQIWCTPQLSDAEFDAFALTRLEPFDLVPPCLLKIMQRQREMAAQAKDVNAYGVIGGRAQLLTVTRTGVEKRVFHRWDDRIGAPVNLESRLPASEAPEPSDAHAAGAELVAGASLVRE